MCGIAGFVLKQPNDQSRHLLIAMRDRIRHRGPDGNGTWTSTDGCCGLAHTRLAIVDLSDAAAQPMTNPGANLTLVFNGEIYNWKSLRRRLERYGHKFKTHSDSEVLLAGYAQWGPDVLDELRGMFAFAIWDEAEKLLFCARDRMGKKPFVFAEGPDGIVFASEIPAVLTGLWLAGADRDLDAGAFASMLLHNMRHMPDPATAYKAVRRLRAGHAMIVRNGRIERNWRYWDPMADCDVSGRDSARYLRNALEEAVELRRIADVPVGALLSGGVDSTAIVALAQAQAKEPVRTFALGMDEKDEDLVRARSMAKSLGTVHREFYFDPASQWEAFNRILQTYGEPIMLLPLVHTYELCRKIRNDGIKVVLSGNGADELFYGYTGMVRTNHLSQVVRRLELLSPLVRMLPQEKLPRSLKVLATERGQRKSRLYEGYGDEIWPDLIRSELSDGLKNYAEDEMARWGLCGPHENYIDESAFAGLMVENTHSVTIASDLPAMMAGVEMRAPFLDQEIVVAALHTTWQEKLPQNGDLTQLKKVLKSAVSDLMPPEILYASKRGFGMGIQERDVLLGPWRSHADNVFERSEGLSEVFDSERVRGLWRDAKNGGGVRWDLIAKLFAIGVWKQSHSRGVD